MIYDVILNVQIKYIRFRNGISSNANLVLFHLEQVSIDSEITFFRVHCTTRDNIFSYNQKTLLTNVIKIKLTLNNNKYIFLKYYLINDEKKEYSNKLATAHFYACSDPYHRKQIAKSSGLMMNDEFYLSTLYSLPFCSECRGTITLSSATRHPLLPLLPTFKIPINRFCLHYN